MTAVVAKTLRRTAGPKPKPLSPAKRSASPRGARAKPDRNRLRLVIHQRRRISYRAMMAASVVAFFLVLLAAVSIQTLRAEGDRTIDALDSEIRTDAERYLELRAELAEQESPARVMSEARLLGMIDPGPVAPLAAPDDARVEALPDPAQPGTEAPSPVVSSDPEPTERPTPVAAPASPTGATASDRSGIEGE